MLLVDTSVWVDHLRRTGTPLAKALRDEIVLIHPLVLGELACGNLSDRANFLKSLAALPRAAVATDDEVLHLIEDRKLFGLGIGWIDAQLLASALLSHCTFWTHNKRLLAAAVRARVAVRRTS